MNVRRAPCPTFPDIRLVVYDMDGTLVDAFIDIWRGINSVFASHGLPARSFDEVKVNVGDGAHKLIERLLPPESAGRVEELYRAYREQYAAQPIKEAGLYPGVPEVLDRLRKARVTQVILTNKPEEVARPICEQLGLIDRIDGLWGEREGHAMKPDPEALLQIVRQYDLAPRECAMIGDGLPDSRAARAAGTRFFAATWGQMDYAAMAALSPDALLADIRDLAPLIGR